MLNNNAVVHAPEAWKQYGFDFTVHKTVDSATGVSGISISGTQETPGGNGTKVSFGQFIPGSVTDGKILEQVEQAIQAQKLQYVRKMAQYDDDNNVNDRTPINELLKL